MKMELSTEIWTRRMVELAEFQSLNLPKLKMRYDRECWAMNMDNNRKISVAGIRQEGHQSKRNNKLLMTEWVWALLQIWPRMEE